MFFSFSLFLSKSGPPRPESQSPQQSLAIQARPNVQYSLLAGIAAFISASRPVDGVGEGRLRGWCGRISRWVCVNRSWSMCCSGSRRWRHGSIIVGNPRRSSLARARRRVWQLSTRSCLH
jgi:hypothetical protein